MSVREEGEVAMVLQWGRLVIEAERELGTPGGVAPELLQWGRLVIEAERTHPDWREAREDAELQWGRLVIEAERRL